MKFMEEKNWFYKDYEGNVLGPVDQAKMESLIISNVVSAQTLVSSDNDNWIEAIKVNGLGFDCIALSMNNGIEMFGPFSREYISNEDMMRSIPSDGILFIRTGSVSEALVNNGYSKTGAKLVEKVFEAEKSVRNLEKKISSQEAALTAKDLEFDSERQILNAKISELKAENLKLKTLKDEVEKDKSILAEAELKAGEFEARLIDMESSYNKSKKQVADLNKKIEDLNAKVATTEEQLANVLLENQNISKANVDLSDSKHKLEQYLADAQKNIDQLKKHEVELQDKVAVVMSEKDFLESDLKSQIDKLNLEMERSKQNYLDMLKDLQGNISKMISDVITSSSDVSSISDKSEPSEPETVVETNVVEEVEVLTEEEAELVRKKQSAYSSKKDTQVNKSLLEEQLKMELSKMSKMSGSKGKFGSKDGFLGIKLKK